MSNNLSTFIQNNLTGGKWWSAAAGSSPYIMGNPPKIIEWRADGDPGISVSGLEENHLDIGSCGKTGKNAKNDDRHVSQPGAAACSLLPGEVRHSLANGVMENEARNSPRNLIN